MTYSIVVATWISCPGMVAFIQALKGPTRIQVVSVPIARGMSATFIAVPALWIWADANASAGWAEEDHIDHAEGVEGGNTSPQQHTKIRPHRSFM